MKSFGSDPELMLLKNEQPHSAIDVIKGSIDNRIELNGHQFYYDNVLAECAIKPGYSREEVIQNFKECLKIYADLAKPFKLSAKASANFENDQLSHPDARRVGCAKDFCAYEMKQKNGPIDQISGGNLRSCGGHIHLGSDVLTSDGAEPILAIYMLDLFVGVPSLWMDKDPSSPQRRLLYGHAGRYRVKSYGLEYRSLGNFWLKTPELVGLIYDLSMFVIDFVESGKAWDLWEFDFDKFLESDDPASAWNCKAYDAKSLLLGINQTDKNLVDSHFDIAKQLLPKKILEELIEIINCDYKDDLYENWDLI